MQLTLAEKAAKLRAARIESLLNKKETKVEFSLSRATQDEVAIAGEIQTIRSDDAQSLQRSAASESEETIEIKPGIYIPRPTKEITFEELVAIAEKFQDPNAPYVVSMMFCTDGRVIRNYSDGTITEKYSGAK